MRLGPFTVRIARREDADALLPLIQALNASEDIHHSDERLRPALLQLLGAPEIGLALVAETGDRAVGYAILTYGFDLEWAGRDAFVTDVYVVEEHRRRGIARALIQALEREARARGAGALHLAVRPEKSGAGSLYASLGFEPAPRTLMTKPLPPGSADTILNSGSRRK
jgi:ribosomal protein S18 acetylase RimI-like enzyme